MNDLQKLVEFNGWANEEWLWFLSAHQPDNDVLHHLISHIMLGEHVWLQRIHGEDPDREIWKILELSALSDMLARHQEYFSRLLRGDTDRQVRYTRFTGEEYRSSIADILFHLVLHGMHHRGQMAAEASAMNLRPITRITFSITG